jgi:hypothetical protein
MELPSKSCVPLTASTFGNIICSTGITSKD